MTQQKTKQNDATLPLYNLHSLSTTRKFRGTGAQPSRAPIMWNPRAPITRRARDREGHHRAHRASRQSLPHPGPVWTGGDLHGQSCLFGSVTDFVKYKDSQFILSRFKLLISIYNVGRVYGSYVHLVQGEYLWAFCYRRRTRPTITPCPPKTPEHNLPWPSLHYPKSSPPNYRLNQIFERIGCILIYRIVRTNL